MKTRSLFVSSLLMLVFIPHVPLGAAGSAQPAADEQLTKIEHEWGDSYVKRDSSYAQRITTDDFTFVGPDGNMANKIDYVKSVAGPTVFTAFAIENIKVRIYGDAAVVTGTAAIAAKTGSKDESGKYAFTDTFVKQGGEWKAVSGQATPIATSK
jgi:ketosteroid isomerase-like protein